jgi:hypothetical protein
MTRDDIIRMAREAGGGTTWWPLHTDTLERFAALVRADERNKVAQWMMAQGYATGHGDTTEDLLEELDWQITESWSKVIMASVEAEREANALLCEQLGADGYGSLAIAAAIRLKGKE